VCLVLVVMLGALIGYGRSTYKGSFIKTHGNITLT
jgi:hypothetical protein